jgi:hypothetical protein
MHRPADAAAPHVGLQVCKASLLVNDTCLSTADQDALCGAVGWSMAAHHSIWQFASMGGTALAVPSRSSQHGPPKGVSLLRCVNLHASATLAYACVQSADVANSSRARASDLPDNMLILSAGCRL